MSLIKAIMVLLLVFSFLIMGNSCGLMKDQEAEDLRKEVADLKKEKEDQKYDELQKEIEKLKKEKEEGSKSDKATTTKPAPRKTLPITNQAASDLIDRWEKAQDTRDYNAYKSCYAPEFTGIKLTKSGKKSRMNYSQWLNDRRKMLKNVESVDIQGLNIQISGDTATAEFTQNFKSKNYQDSGTKVMKIKMFSDGAQIVSEEMTSSS